MSDIEIIYDEFQHCTALKMSKELAISMDCHETGVGAEFSPINLVESALGGCMLLSMGKYAKEHDVDVTGVAAHVDITKNSNPPFEFERVDVQVNFPRGITKEVGERLQHAAETSPIMLSLAETIRVRVNYFYPALEGVAV